MLFLIKFFTNESCPHVSYLMNGAKTLKDAKLKLKILETLMSQIRPLLAKVSLSFQRHFRMKIMKHTFVMNFILHR